MPAGRRPPSVSGPGRGENPTTTALDGRQRQAGAVEVLARRFERGKYVRRKSKGVAAKRLNEHETRLLQQGAKRIAIVSGAGATGICLHADIAAKNRQRQVFYALQLSWSADQQMQVFGRVDRFALGLGPDHSIGPTPARSDR